MKYKLSKNLFVVLIIVFGISSSLVTGQSPEFSQAFSRAKFEEITDNLDANNEFTFDLSANSVNVKAFSLYGEKFILVLETVNLYEGDERWDIKRQPAITFKFSPENANSTIRLLQPQGEEKGGGFTRQIENNPEYTMIYSLSIGGKIVVPGSYVNRGSEGSYFRIEFPRGDKVIGGLEILFSFQDQPKIFALIAKNPDVNNQKATFLVKEIKENQELKKQMQELEISKTSAQSQIISNSNESQNNSYNLVWNKKMGAKIFNADLSSDGKIIAVISGIETGGTIGTTTTTILDNKGNSIWSNTKGQGSKGRGMKLALSPEGDCFSMPFPYAIYLYPDFITKPLWIQNGKGDEGGNLWAMDTDVSSNCNLIPVIVTGTVYLLNTDFRTPLNRHNSL